MALKNYTISQKIYTVENLLAMTPCYDVAKDKPILP